MDVIIPLDIQDANFISSTVPEPDVNEAQWSGANTYSALDIVSVIAPNTHKRYLSKRDGNTNVPPVPKPNENISWKDLGTTNRWKMFDRDRNIKTVGDSPMIVKITPNQRISALAVTGMEADYFDLSIRENDIVIYQVSESLETRNTTTWREYFFGKFTTKPDVYFNDLPLVFNSEIALTLTKNQGQVKVGGLKIGTRVFLGSLELGAQAPRINFSKVERDPEFGDVVLTPRKNIPTLEGTLFVKKANLNLVIKTLLILEAIPTVWAGIAESSDGYFQTIFINGFIRQYTPALIYPDHAEIEIEIEEI